MASDDKHLPKSALAAIGKNLRALREKLIDRPNVKVAAERMSVSHSQLSEWETGTNAPSLKSLIRLACFYAVTIDTILIGADPNYDKVIVSALPPAASAIVQARLNTLLSALAAVAEAGQGTPQPAGEPSEETSDAEPETSSGISKPARAHQRRKGKGRRRGDGKK